MLLLFRYILANFVFKNLSQETDYADQIGAKEQLYNELRACEIKMQQDIETLEREASK